MFTSYSFCSQVHMYICPLLHLSSHTYALFCKCLPCRKLWIAWTHSLASLQPMSTAVVPVVVVVLLAEHSMLTSLLVQVITVYRLATKQSMSVRIFYSHAHEPFEDCIFMHSSTHTLESSHKLWGLICLTTFLQDDTTTAPILYKSLHTHY